MCESTPVKRFQLRESTPKSPLRKRNSPFKVPATPINQSDESERTKRRSMVDMQRRLSQSSTESSSTHVGETEIKNHFDICLKMFAENKINVKNAWNLKIIDYMRSLIKLNKFAKSSLLMGSTSLDVGTKVYSIRVDDVHSEGLKLASSMARLESSEKTAAPDDIGDGEQNSEGVKEVPKKKKRQRRASENKHTIGKDMYSNISDVPKVESATFQTRTNSDWSSIDNFFTSKLPTNHSGSKLVFLSKEKFWQTNCELDTTLLTEKILPFNLEEVPTKIKLCKEFGQMEIDNWDPTKDDEEDDMMSTASFNQNELVFDDKGMPIAELDGDVRDIFNDPPADDGLDYLDADDDDVKMVGIHGDIVNVCDLKPLVDDPCGSNDYLYQTLDNDKYFSQIWAGPSHWKLKYLKRTAAKFSGVSIQKNTSKPKRKQLKVPDPPLDFESIENLLKEIDTNKTVSENHNPSVDYAKITLPQNLGIKAPLPLQIKRKAFVNRNVMKENNNTEVEKVERFQNEIFPENIIDVNDDCDDDNANFDDQREPIEENLDAQMGFTGSNLIDKPELVPDTTINFVKHAKKINMKKLKSAIMNELESNTNSGSKAFVGVYKNLPNHINRKMKEDLSPAVALVAILHLANENNFALEQIGVSNFSIKKTLI